MSKFIPVDPEKWAAMVIAQSDLVRYKEICDELDAECTRLKDENARLRSFCTRTIIPNIDLEKENARLKAEVERLTKDNEQLQNRCDFLEGKQP
jgi:predicted nuclease with TOPRIM domain